ncbi:hypothetical protein D3OALGA1CA_2434 [Olavius algarvensis associated proteobacterium Delta 3]|nr:hypothetical protein D3OALGA1CA_2434 [Olavius algarvensis associated proteobacterium Delta 3]CAB5155486.1 hypothetical protein D3OALGB2SA_5077 [Olavius algarvensis associated proteobacterium Delta 3]
MLYTISGLKQMYGDWTVLDIPRLSIDEGDIYALLGPNGAGKTTLLNILGFLSRPSIGTIRFRSRDVHFSEPALQAFRREVVMVDQTPILFTSTVYRNVEFGLKVRRIPAAERQRMIADALDLVGMNRFAHAMGHHLSGGETQRVALARALVVEPRVLLCDEPTASVDAEHQATVMAILKRINREKRISIIFTTHDRLQAVSLGKQMIYLNQGRLASNGLENVFPATLTPVSRGQLECTVQGAIRLTLPATASHRDEKRGRILIDPARLSLKERAHPKPAANRFSGRVVQLSEEKGHIRMVVDVGIGLHLLLKPATYRKNPPLVGDRVDVSIPPDAVRFI